ncbi:MAG: hypothetical protein GY812_01355 [Actinomycetia bacterium]|nr:hypothetical protein [Actinomycetes bacterium]
MAPGAGAVEGDSADEAPSASGTTTTTVPGRRASAEASVASLKVDRAAVRAQLAEAGAARNQQFDEWSLNHLAAGKARIEADQAAERAAQAAADVVVAEERVKEYANEAFMNPPAFESQAVLSISDADAMSWAHELLVISADDKHRVVGELQVAERTAARRASQANDALAAAGEKAAAEKAKLDELQAAVSRQEELAAQVESRLDDALAEVAALEAIDRRAAAELAEQEEALAEESRTLVAGAKQTQPKAGSAGGGSSSPGTTAPSRPRSPTTTAPKPTGPPPPPPSGIVTWQDVTRAGGIWVNKSIAGSVSALVSAAAADGISLSGGGFRDPAEQIRLRQAHCGPTQYDIYEKRASLCTPPTAQPGRSMHERGLAIDFKSSGRLITSRSDPGYQWLAANAASYGLYNLPSEPWHWSVNGN